MNPLRALLLSLSLLTLGVAATACDGPGQPIDTGETGDDDDDLDATFTTGVHPMLNDESCGNGTGCHAAALPQGGLELPAPGFPLDPAATHASILAGGEEGPAVDTSNAELSLLLRKGLGEAHTGGQQWLTTDDSYITVLAWISSGALFN